MANKKISSFDVVPPLPTDRLPVARPVAGPNPFINEAVEVQGVVDLAQAYTNVAYPSIQTVNDALDKLLYTSLAVTSFSNNVGTVEIGTVISAVNLSWSYNKSNVVSQSMAPTPGTLSPTLRTLALTGLNLTADTMFTVTGNDGSVNASGSTGIAFRNRRYWGVSSNPALTDPTALAGSEFASGRQQSRSMSASGQYLYFAWPSSFGVPSFVVNGLPVSGWVQTTVSWTNASGYTTNYDIWRSQYIQSGSGIAVVVN